MNAESIAELLRNAELNKIPIDPVRDIIGVNNLELAYTVQGINNQIRINEGARVTGKKVGLTSFAVQQQLGVDQPDFGLLFQDREILNGQRISTSEIMQGKVEAEIAFILSQDLDYENITITDLIDSIDYALPAIEIAGSRIKDWNIKITDTIADNASASHYVLGHRPVTLDEFDMVGCNMEMTMNGKTVSTGKGSACLGSPLNALHWLANKMFEIGNPLLGGELILSGALGIFADVEAGTEVVAKIEGLGSVSVNFE